MNNILDKLRKKYPMLQEEPLLADLEMQLGDSGEEAPEDLGPEIEDLGEGEDMALDMEALAPEGEEDEMLPAPKKGRTPPKRKKPEEEMPY